MSCDWKKGTLIRLLYGQLLPVSQTFIQSSVECVCWLESFIGRVLRSPGVDLDSWNHGFEVASIVFNFGRVTALCGKELSLFRVEIEDADEEASQ